MATTPNYSWETPDDTDLISISAGMLRTTFNSVDTTVFGVSQTANGVNAFPVPRTGDYFGNANSFDGGTTAAATIDSSAQRLYLAPIFLPVAMTVDRIAVQVTTAVAGTLSALAIYNHSATTFRPSTLLLNAGTINTGTTGLKSITISQALNAGIYWVALLNRQANTGYLCVRDNSYTSKRYYFDDSTADYFNTSERHSFFYIQTTVTSLPATVGAGANWNGLQAIPEASMPMIGLRRA
jgi:hypothetical protein